MPAQHDPMTQVVFQIAFVAAWAFISAISATIFGALIGWCVGITFPHTFHDMREALHIGPIAAWQAGAMLGFAGSFFRSPPPTTTKP